MYLDKDTVTYCAWVDTLYLKEGAISSPGPIKSFIT